MATSSVNSEPTAAMRRAIELLQAGRTVEAEEVVAKTVEEAKKRFGPETPEYAQAQSELGAVLMAVGQFDRAADAMRAACDVPAKDEQSLRDRFTNLMTLGQVLERAGRLDEAQQALLEGLEGRERYYGRQHPGYAFGLEPLAELMLRKGQADTALDMINEVIRNFGRNGHPRIAGAIALRAEMMHAAGKVDRPFAIIEKLPPEIVEQVAQKATERVGQSRDLKINRAVLKNLVSALSTKLGDSHAKVLEIWIAISNVERMLEKEGDPQIRQGAIKQVINIYERQNRPREALQAVLGLALAQSETQQNDDSIENYQKAIRLADELNDPAQRAQVLRNFGLLLAEMDKLHEADLMLRDAVSAAGLSGDKEMLARCQIALGIFLQHHGRIEEARSSLTGAVGSIDPAHPDAITARSHLRAIEQGGSCGCGDTGAAIADAFRDFVLSRLPKDLLSRLDVELKDGDFEIGVHLQREPSQEELAHLERVVNHALQEFRARLLKTA